MKRQNLWYIVVTECLSAAECTAPLRPSSLPAGLCLTTGFSLDLQAKSSFLLLRLSLLPLSHFCIDHFSLRLRHLMCVNYLFHLSVYSFVIKSLITLSLSGIVLQMNAVSILFSFPGPCQLSLHKQCVVSRYSSSAHQHVQPIWTLFINRNRNMFLKHCAVQDNCLRYSVHTVFTVHGPLPFSVDVSLGLCFNSGSALF